MLWLTKLIKAPEKVKEEKVQTSVGWAVQNRHTTEERVSAALMIAEIVNSWG
ncbi:MAG: hypothetical protein V2A57_00980 [Elusimicrobiota bacterium]|nr:hypothetical protein [Elusimicrobiota bacterium]